MHRHENSKMGFTLKGKTGSGLNLRSTVSGCSLRGVRGVVGVDQMKGRSFKPKGETKLCRFAQLKKSIVFSESLQTVFLECFFLLSIISSSPKLGRGGGLCLQL